MLVSEFVAELSKIRPSSTFLVIHKYRNEQSELADFNILFHISYKNALEKSLKTLEAFEPKDDLQKQAQQELIVSFLDSLYKIDTTKIDEIDDGYQRFFDENSLPIKGIKLHISTNMLHLFGLVVHKKIYLPGKYPKINSKPLTIAKNELRHLTPVGKFRQFRITAGQVDSIRVEKLMLLPPEQRISV